MSRLYTYENGYVNFWKLVPYQAKSQVHYMRRMRGCIKVWFWIIAVPFGKTWEWFGLWGRK